jgi:hypothetical protein
MKEYKIDDYITLRLEDNKTVIYIKGERFLQCKYLLLINPQKKEGQEEIGSIDEAVDVLNTELERELRPRDFGITPEQEFWGHCSNIEAWVENNYDTRLLHRNLAFYLLLELTKKGNNKAKMILKEEIAKRLGAGNKNVITFLLESSFISYLKEEEIIHSILTSEEAEIVLTMESELGIELIWTFWKTEDSCTFYVDNRHVKEINLKNLKIEKFPNILGELEYLEKINISNNNITKIPLSILEKLKNLKDINLKDNLISDKEINKIKENFPDLTLI